jgi:hypothetical protein
MWNSSGVIHLLLSYTVALLTLLPPLKSTYFRFITSKDEQFGSSRGVGPYCLNLGHGYPKAHLVYNFDLKRTRVWKK